MSPDIEVFIDRTAVCAADREHGWAEEQAVPVPDGEANSVVVAAAAGGGWANTTAAAAKPARANLAAAALRGVVRVMGSPQVVSGRSGRALRAVKARCLRAQ